MEQHHGIDMLRHGTQDTVPGTHPVEFYKLYHYPTSQAQAPIVQFAITNANTTELIRIRDIINNHVYSNRDNKRSYSGGDHINSYKTSRPRLKHDIGDLPYYTLTESNWKTGIMNSSF